MRRVYYVPPPKTPFLVRLTTWLTFILVAFLLVVVVDMFLLDGRILAAVTGRISDQATDKTGVDQAPAAGNFVAPALPTLVFRPENVVPVITSSPGSGQAAPAPLGSNAGSQPAGSTIIIEDASAPALNETGFVAPAPAAAPAYNNTASQQIYDNMTAAQQAEFHAPVAEPTATRIVIIAATPISGGYCGGRSRCPAGPTPTPGVGR